VVLKLFYTLTPNESIQLSRPPKPMAYAENFHGGFHSVACGGHLHLVCVVCDVTI